MARMSLIGTGIAALGLVGALASCDAKLPESFNIKVDSVSQRVVYEPEDVDAKLIPESAHVEVYAFLNGKPFSDSRIYDDSGRIIQNETGLIYSGPAWKDGEYVLPQLWQMLNGADIIGVVPAHQDSLDHRRTYIRKETRDGTLELEYRIDVRNAVPESNEKDNVVKVTLSQDRLEDARSSLSAHVNRFIDERRREQRNEHKIKELEAEGYNVTKTR